MLQVCAPAVPEPVQSKGVPAWAVAWVSNIEVSAPNVTEVREGLAESLNVVVMPAPGMILSSVRCVTALPLLSSVCPEPLPDGP